MTRRFKSAAFALAAALALLAAPSAEAGPNHPAPWNPPWELVGWEGCASWVEGEGFDLLKRKARENHCKKLCKAHYADKPGAAACYRSWNRIATRKAVEAKVGRHRPSVAKSSTVPAGYELVFADEFDDLNLRDYDPRTHAGPPRGWLDFWLKWSIRTLDGNRDQGVKMKDETLLPRDVTAKKMLDYCGGKCGSYNRYLHEVWGGKLHLRAFEIPQGLRYAFWDGRYVASMISAEGWFAHQYGYWEVRARIPRMGQGHHLAIWLLPEGPSWPPEFDIMEAVNTSKTFYANAHPERRAITKYAAPNGEGNWHTFGLEWTKNQIVWTVDGNEVRRQPNYVFDKKMFPLISWEIGGRWPGWTDDTTPWPAEAEIDYIRVYQK